jgi:hypothetical protein
VQDEGGAGGSTGALPTLDGERERGFLLCNLPGPNTSLSSFSCQLDKSKQQDLSAYSRVALGIAFAP